MRWESPLPAFARTSFAGTSLILYKVNPVILSKEPLGWLNGYLIDNALSPAIAKGLSRLGMMRSTCATIKCNLLQTGRYLNGLLLKVVL